MLLASFKCSVFRASKNLVQPNSTCTLSFSKLSHAALYCSVFISQPTLDTLLHDMPPLPTRRPQPSTTQHASTLYMLYQLSTLYMPPTTIVARCTTTWCPMCLCPQPTAVVAIATTHDAIIIPCSFLSSRQPANDKHFSSFALLGTCSPFPHANAHAKYSKSQFNNIYEQQSLKLWLISIPRLIWYWVQSNSMFLDIYIRTNLVIFTWTLFYSIIRPFDLLLYEACSKSSL